MSTATIGLKLPDGTFKVVYCHCDNGSGKTATLLAQHYDSIEKVDRLVQRGNLFMLDTDPESVIYFTDRGVDAKVVAPTTVASQNELLENYKHKHFYLFIDGEWHIHVKDEFLKYEWRTAQPQTV